MNGWFLTVIIIYALSLWNALENHGKTREVKSNFWASLIFTLFFLALMYKAIQAGF